MKAIVFSLKIAQYYLFAYLYAVLLNSIPFHATNDDCLLIVVQKSPPLKAQHMVAEEVKCWTFQVFKWYEWIFFCYFETEKKFKAPNAQHMHKRGEMDAYAKYLYIYGFEIVQRSFIACSIVFANNKNCFIQTHKKQTQCIVLWKRASFNSSLMNAISLQSNICTSPVLLCLCLYALNARIYYKHKCWSVKKTLSLFSDEVYGTTTHRKNINKKYGAFEKQRTKNVQQNTALVRANAFNECIGLLFIWLKRSKCTHA